MAESTGGLRLEGVARRGAWGTWWSASTADGRRRGLLQLEPDLVDAPGATERVTATVAAVRALNLPGVMRTADPVGNAGRVWMVAAGPVVPTVAQLIAARRVPDAVAAAFIAVDVGRSLVRLHEAGLVHGGLEPETVVLTGRGAAVLVEAGLGAALRGVPAPPAADISAWAALVRALAGSLPPGAHNSLFAEAAAAAESGPAGGLVQAVRQLSVGAVALPGSPNRDGLVAAVVDVAAALASSATASTATASPATPSPSMAVGSPTTASHATTSPPPPALSPQEATQLGRRARMAADELPPDESTSADGIAAEIRLRFGPGVPAIGSVRPPTPGPVGPAGRGPSAGPTARARVPASTPAAPTRHRRLRAILSGALTLAVVGGVGGVLWWRFGNSLAVTGAAVAPAQPVGITCDTTVDVVGTLQTNGRAGTLRYQWMRNDGQTSEVFERRAAAGEKTISVHLHWTFSGEGTYQAKATLQVLAPTAMQAGGEFTYSCSPGA